jgi:hypothetical protein
MSAKKEDAPVKMSLLEKAHKLSCVPDRHISPEYRQEAEVYIAWIMGEIDLAAACEVLNLPHSSAIAQQAAIVLRNVATAGLISITWKG